MKLNMSTLNNKPDSGAPDEPGKYEIRIDNKDVTVERGTLTGQEILALVRKDYAEWTLHQKLRGGRRKPIEADQEVDITSPEIERFETVKRQAQQGTLGL